MIDLTEFGKAGLILQYEDIISMIGFNVAKRFHQQGISKKLDSMSIGDVLLSYVNRTDEDYSIWLENEFGIKINKKEMLTSFLTMQPNLLYSYRVFSTAHIEKVNNLYIYSNDYSPIIEESTKHYGFDGITYIKEDIISFLNNNPNYTYITSSVDNIKRCTDLKAPTCLVICDDYLYISDIFSSKVDKTLEGLDNIILRYTGIISAGIID